MDIRRFWSRPRWRSHALLSIVALSLAAGIAAGKPQTSPIPIHYPEGFREWTHVKSALVWPETAANAPFSGLHNIYANDSAMIGYRRGSFPDGAVIIFDLFEVDVGSGGFAPGKRKAIDVMVRDTAHPHKWRFERFYAGDPSRRADSGTKADCLACHSREKEGDLVFSRFIP